MSPFLKGIDFIEQNLGARFELADIARAAGYSPYHFCRLFLALSGDTVMGYVRKRRLTRAAEALLAGDDRLIDIALDSGFESQAAFTRAFKRHFALAPGEIRRSGRTWLARRREPFDASQLQLKETITMQPTFTERGDIHIVGLREPVDKEAGGDGTPVWRAFRSRIGDIRHRTGCHAYGVVEVGDKVAGEFAYWAGVEVDRTDDVPDGLTSITLTGGRFAVFTVKLAGGDIGAELKRTFKYIYGTWVPKAGAKLRAYYDLEVYDEHFDPQTLTGEVDIWVPVM